MYMSSLKAYEFTSPTYTQSFFKNLFFFSTISTSALELSGEFQAKALTTCKLVVAPASTIAVGIMPLQLLLFDFPNHPKKVTPSSHSLSWLLWNHEFLLALLPLPEAYSWLLIYSNNISTLWFHLGQLRWECIHPKFQQREKYLHVLKLSRKSFKLSSMLSFTEKIVMFQINGIFLILK